MQNHLYTPSYQYPYNQLQQHDDLEDHFNTLLGESQSRYTAAQTIISTNNNEQTFHSSRMFAIGTLQSWGLKIGTLAYSRDNEITLKCILDLISQKQKDIDYKMKIKQQVNAINFQKEKYESFLKQAKHTIGEKQKLLGKLENQSTELKKRIRQLENQYKKEKTQDQKMIMMLKSKNQQILHEIKKKQVEALRVKQQMKKTVISKTTNNTSPIHNNNATVKNSFQLIQKLQRIGVKAQKWKKNITERTTRSDNIEEEKFNFMMDKYEKEKKILLNENGLLRNKVYEIRDQLVKFAEWIEVELFGQSLESTKKFLEKRFICNHNLMFSQNALIQDLLEIINQSKNGIQQLQQRVQHSQAGSMPSLKSIQSPRKKVGFTNPSTKSIGSESNPMFKKKSTSIREIDYSANKSPMNSRSQKSIKDSHMQSRVKQKQKALQQRPQQRQPRVQASKSPQIMKAAFSLQQNQIVSFPSQIRRSSKQQYFNELQLSAFQNDILSDIYEHSGSEDPDHSIVSHISANELLKQIEKGKVNSSKYDKWDILFKADEDL